MSVDGATIHDSRLDNFAFSARDDVPNGVNLGRELSADRFLRRENTAPCSGVDGSNSGYYFVPARTNEEGVKFAQCELGMAGEWNGLG